MDSNLAQKAISFALKGEWEKASELNKQIIKDNPKDIDALNRLARSYAELGDIKNAKLTARKSLKIDPFNNIALKSLEKWKTLKKGESIQTKSPSAQSFLEEPGKTKLVNLLHVCGADILAKLDAGDEVKINTYGHRITITTHDGKYIGKLPDDLSAHMRKLIKFGNEYSAFIKNIDTKGLIRIFIKEIKRGEKLADIPSFTSEKIDYISFTPPELVHKRETVEIEEEIESE